MRQTFSIRKSIEQAIVNLKKQRDAIDAELARLMAMLKASEPKKAKTTKVKRKKPVKVRRTGDTRTIAMRLLKHGATSPSDIVARGKKAGVTYQAAYGMLNQLVAEKVAARRERGVYVEVGN